jgi:23S rRNA pseudouridine955/2504/2580 synthase
VRPAVVSRGCVQRCIQPRRSQPAFLMTRTALCRLDRDTSGVLLLAKGAKAARELGVLFSQRSVDKEYWALVAGVPREPTGTVSTPLVSTNGFVQTSATPGDGDSAVTHYRVAAQHGDAFAWLCMEPKTGRKHQLRVHAAQVLGTPMVGDDTYGQAAASVPELRKLLPRTRRLFLHARTVRLRHPASEKPLRITAPLPEHMETVWKALGWSRLVGDS